ncbi:ABC transporter permease [Bacillus sp. BRMEA1]|uniref:ABC transporter permease n=1 Tax=Neobacillus endophyticus TaxID=2738405 RepID=UPI001564A81A|nr:ABC transporter permease [Neobacillus endophyticus]NRD78473.1 ABC transporter permease [Neobacillus endophyticus]
MIGAFIKKELKRMSKERGMFFFLIILPILFIVMFSTILGNQNYTFQIHYIDQDHSALSKDFIHHLSPSKTFELVKESDEKEVLAQIKKGKDTNLLIIDKGFESSIKSGQSPILHFYYDKNQSSAQEVAPIKTLVENIINGYNQAKIQTFVQSHSKNVTEAHYVLSPSIDLKSKAVSVKKVNAITSIVPGYTVMFVFFILMSMARTFIRERDSGMLARLYATSITRFQYTFGMWIPCVIVVLIQIAVLLGFGYFAYHLSLGNIPSLIVLSFILTLAVTTLGLVISFYTKSEQMAIGLTQIITMGGAALGGLWVPLDIMPKSIQTIAHFLPQYWAQTGYVNIMTRGANLADILPTLYYLIGFSIICFILALVGFKNFFKGATN